MKIDGLINILTIIRKMSGNVDVYISNGEKKDKLFSVVEEFEKEVSVKLTSLEDRKLREIN